MFNMTLLSSTYVELFSHTTINSKCWINMSHSLPTIITCRCGKKFSYEKLTMEIIYQRKDAFIVLLHPLIQILINGSQVHVNLFICLHLAISFTKVLNKLLKVIIHMTIHKIITPCWNKILQCPLKVHNLCAFLGDSIDFDGLLEHMNMCVH